MKRSITSKPQLNSERIDASSTLSKDSRYLLPDCIKPLKYSARATQTTLVFFIQASSTQTMYGLANFFGKLSLYWYMW